MTPTPDIEMSESNRTLTRRRVVALLAGASATGLGAVAVATDDVRAEITLGTVTIADGEYAAADPTVTPTLSVDARLRWSAPSVSAVESALAVAPATADTSPATIATDRREIRVTDGDMDRTLVGPVTDAAAYAAADFRPDAGETVEERLTVALRLRVLDGSETVAEAETTTETTVTVSNTATATTARVGGEGEVRFETPDE